MKKNQKEKLLSDKLESMWNQQESFIKLLQEKRNFPKFPVEISSKEGQKFLKDLSYECMHELFEAIQLLKNSKNHRITDVSEIDFEKFKEELSDSFHYFIEICIVAGISADDLYESYTKKGNINVDRINNGY